jgi:hypothetical protein
MGPNPCGDDWRTDGLVDEVNRAHGKTELLVFGSHFGSQENDRNMPRRGSVPELTADLKAVHARHHDVKQHQVWWRGKGILQRLDAIIGHLDTVVFLQQIGQQRQIGRRVVNDQKRRSGRARTSG